jgi:hypothetical protein
VRGARSVRVRQIAELVLHQLGGEDLRGRPGDRQPPRGRGRGDRGESGERRAGAGGGAPGERERERAARLVPRRYGGVRHQGGGVRGERQPEQRGGRAGVPAAGHVAAGQPVEQADRRRGAERRQFLTFGVPYDTQVWLFRGAIFVVPVIVYMAAGRIARELRAAEGS